MRVFELIRYLQMIPNQNKEIHIKEMVVTEDSFYSTSKPITKIKEYDDKVVIK